MRESCHVFVGGIHFVSLSKIFLLDFCSDSVVFLFSFCFVTLIYSKRVTLGIIQYI